MKAVLLVLNFSMLMLVPGKQVPWEREENWEPCAKCGVAALIAYSRSPGPTVVPKRTIYLFIAASDFTLDSLTKVFSSLSAAYPVPAFLKVVVRSDKDVLKKLITASEGEYVPFFVDSPEGKEARRRYYSDLYPQSKGYYSALFFRLSEDDTSFQYTPDPNSDKMERISLKGGSKRVNN